MTLGTDNPNHKGLDNISVTAYRIISILNMLLEGTYSDKEINERLQKDIIGARSLSQDTICIYINTLRALGCVISRPSKNNNFKYVLTSHPFKLVISDEEMQALIELRKYISSLNDWKLMIGIDKLYNSISENLDPENKKKFLDIIRASLRDMEINHQTQLITLLEKYCAKKKILLVTYISPESGEKSFEMQVDKLSYENGAFYLWGVNTDKEEVQYLRVDRIKEIRLIAKNSRYTPKVYTVHYKLCGIQALMYVVNEDEVVIDRNDREVIIEAKVQSKFKFIQRILSYGSSCTILSPESFRKEIVSMLKSMVNIYKHIEII